jgi:hypothetical protein
MSLLGFMAISSFSGAAALEALEHPFSSASAFSDVFINSTSGAIGFVRTSANLDSSPDLVEDVECGDPVSSFSSMDFKDLSLDH